MSSASTLLSDGQMRVLSPPLGHGGGAASAHLTVNPSVRLFCVSVFVSAVVFVCLPVCLCVFFGVVRVLDKKKRGGGRPRAYFGQPASGYTRVEGHKNAPVPISDLFGALFGNITRSSGQKSRNNGECALQRPSFVEKAPG